MDVKPDRFSGVKRVYENQYKKLLIVPFGLLILAIVFLAMSSAATGEFIKKDVSLKGGVTVTVPNEEPVDIDQLRETIASKFPNNDISTKSLSQLGVQVGVIVEADIEESESDTLVQEIESALRRNLANDDYTIEVVGSSLGESFFRDLVIALVIAFGFMALVVFLYFRNIISSAAVILAALSDIIVTLAVVNVIGLSISAAGIAAFLMLIGYSVDTNILLSTRVLKRREGTVMERIYGALNTGLTMSATTLIALTVALLISQSEVITQIMTILIIGLIVDLIMTWVQNVGIIRLYLERKGKNEPQS